MTWQLLSENRFNLAQQNFALHLSAVTPHLLAVAIDDECRHRFHIGFTCFRFILVNVKLIYLDASLEQLFHLLNYRHHALAVRAPRCIKLNKYYGLAIDNFIVIHKIQSFKIKLIIKKWIYPSIGFVINKNYPCPNILRQKHYLYNKNADLISMNENEARANSYNYPDAKLLHIYNLHHT